MCTRYTGAIDDMLADISPIDGPGGVGDSRLADTAYYQMVNRVDKRKRVVIRRDFATGGRPVSFKFTPTVNKRVMRADNITSPEGQQTLHYEWSTRRVRAPWMKFYEYRRDQSAEGLVMNTLVPHFGMAIAMRVMSCTDGTFPIFDTKVSFDVEYKGAVGLGQAGSATDAIAKSYRIFGDTFGDGFM